MFSAKIAFKFPVKSAPFVISLYHILPTCTINQRFKFFNLRLKSGMAGEKINKADTSCAASAFSFCCMDAYWYSATLEAKISLI